LWSGGEFQGFIDVRQQTGGRSNGACSARTHVRPSPLPPLPLPLPPPPPSSCPRPRDSRQISLSPPQITPLFYLCSQHVGKTCRLYGSTYYWVPGLLVKHNETHLLPPFSLHIEIRPGLSELELGERLITRSFAEGGPHHNWADKSRYCPEFVFYTE
jgi:hypothetical protein